MARDNAKLNTDNQLMAFFPIVGTEPKYYGLVRAFPLNQKLIETMFSYKSINHPHLIIFNAQEISNPDVDPIIIYSENGNRIYLWRSHKWLEFDFPSIPYIEAAINEPLRADDKFMQAIGLYNGSGKASFETKWHDYCSRAIYRCSPIHVPASQE